MVHALVAHARPGDVLVLTSPEPAPVAFVGDLLATQARAQGVAAVLVDGAVRDLDELADLGLPIWTRFVRAQGATKGQVGKLDAAKHPWAVHAALDILDRGGNAVDAAVTAAFAVGVLEPWMSGVGGGGFMTVQMASGERAVVDYFARAPQAARPDLFELSQGFGASEVGFSGVVDDANAYGALSVSALPSAASSSTTRAGAGSSSSTCRSAASP